MAPKAGKKRIRIYLVGKMNNQKGFTYIMALLATVLILVASATIQKQTSYQAHRALESAILFQGQAYADAIASFYQVGNLQQLPTSLNQLINDSRFFHKRHLRREYRLFNGQTWQPIMNSQNHIVGVVAPIDKTPLKKTNFPEHLKSFEGLSSYKDWKFLVEI